MKPLPSRPDLIQLKKQAKDLLGAFRRSDPEAIDRFRRSLPSASGLEEREIIELRLRLRDAQSCLAREYGFDSWADMKSGVEAVRRKSSDPAALAATFYALVYAGDIVGGMNRARPHAAARLLAEHPELPERSPWIACAAGDIAMVRAQVETDASWVNRTGGELGLTPLIATTHSSLLDIAEYRERLHQLVDFLLQAGADPNVRVGKRWASDGQQHEWNVSALHGAAGVNHDPDLTRRLLTAGADPNDGESLYHSLEAPACTRLLLEAGAVVTGTNALFRALDFDDLETFRLLLSHAAGAEELKGSRLLLWAIRRRRSPEHIEALLAAGVDPKARTRNGESAYVRALRYGLPEVADILEKVGVADNVGDEDLFVAACARGEADAARRIQARRPDLPAALDETRLRMLPELAAAGCAKPVGLMVELGWPIEVRGGDWNASALSLAVFRGDAAMARVLLAHGASWTEKHGHGDNVCGTLGWASLNRPVENGDWAACAAALLNHGMPAAKRDPTDPSCVVVAGTRRRFSEEVTAVLLGAAS